MYNITIQDVPMEDRHYLTGKYNASIVDCTGCGKTLDYWDVRVIGFAEWKGDVVVLKECLSCGDIYYHHCVSIEALRGYQRRKYHTT